MLIPVSLNQAGFKIPGVAPDSRGVLLGKQGAILLPSLDQGVAFFRMLSEETFLDDILPSLRVLQVRSRLRSLELLILLPATSSYLLDRCARIAGLLSGLCCTGSGRHFVKYRDRAAPLGYDSDELYQAGGDACDFVLYGDAFVQAYTRARELPFGPLVLRLAPQLQPGGLRRALGLAEEDGEALFLTVRRGLAGHVLHHLWRNGADATAALVGDGLDAGAAPGARDLGEAPPDYALIRLARPEPRLLRLLAALPGVTVFRPEGDNFAVELGYRHPLRLSSCASLFDKERLYLFCGQRGACDVLSRPPLVPLGTFLRAPLTLSMIDPDADKAPPAAMTLRAGRVPGPQQVALRLAPSASAPRRATATLIPWARLAWFKKLVYALPPPLLRGYRAAAIEEGLFVLCPSGVDGLPIGELLREAAPSIFVPVGLDFLPRVGPEVLTEQVGGVAGRYVVFLPGSEEGDAPRVLGLPQALFEPLGRRALAPLAVATRTALTVGGAGLRAQPQRAPSLVSDPRAAFPLWGFRAAEPGPRAPTRQDDPDEEER